MFTVVQEDSRRWWILDSNGVRVHTSSTLNWAIRWIIQRYNIRLKYSMRDWQEYWSVYGVGND